MSRPASIHAVPETSRTDSPKSSPNVYGSAEADLVAVVRRVAEAYAAAEATRESRLPMAAEREAFRQDLHRAVDKYHVAKLSGRSR